MQPLRRLTCAALLFAAAGLAGASPTAPKEGADYLALSDPQPTDSGKKIEVIEFFAYYCPHCYAFEPKLAAWVKKQGDSIVFRRVHVPRGEQVAAQQRLFFTLESLGMLEQYHDKVFNAMHVDHLPLAQDEQVFDWASRAGIDRAKFIDAYRSFGVQAKVRRAQAMMEGYRITHWPMIAVDGRFLTSPGMVNEANGMSGDAALGGTLSVMDALVARARADKK
ncbi:thiol:disulfide interchange protein DsbA/DsbL [Massilia sp. G4R7]|uniref:Thiol:disulfide interchange protein DsbA n=1 Tax=Massilia phyllostachyos TaxID=2898585 RepID=A0ABS8Q9P2_9BURK|nr:thiol:disulfide interchange protein DsbA/DsbL [Massilia phyllostachyos]MCD2518304.1 thiol:disulfide interchange protein DsbA/DsbL [Massilia phyllostachyos]